MKETILKILKPLISGIDEEFSKNELEIIAKQKQDIKKLEKEINVQMIASKIVSDNLTECLVKINKLENQLAGKEEVPKPSFLINKINYRPRRRIVSKTKDIHIWFKDPRDAFDKSVYLTRILKAKGFIGRPKTVKNAQEVMTFLNKQITYENDLLDNFRPITDTLLGGFGDCDDSGGIVLTSAFGICGWKDNETFCSIGYYHRSTSKMLHAYGAVKINGEWYIAEGTDRNAKLIKWSETNKYTCDRGLMNWKFTGQLTGGKLRLTTE